LLAGSKLRELIYSQVGYDPASHTQLLFRFGDQLGRQFHTLKKRRHRQTGAFEAGKSQAGKAPLAPSGLKPSPVQNSEMKMSRRSSFTLGWAINTGWAEQTFGGE
jgi:hypothetical protein